MRANLDECLRRLRQSRTTPARSLPGNVIDVQQSRRSDHDGGRGGVYLDDVASSTICRRSPQANTAALSNGECVRTFVLTYKLACRGIDDVAGRIA
jgi:hypothetical protein